MLERDDAPEKLAACDACGKSVPERWLLWGNTHVCDACVRAWADAPEFDPKVCNARLEQPNGVAEMQRLTREWAAKRKFNPKPQTGATKT